MKDARQTKIPHFKSLQEEREYWEARGPLAPARRGRVNKPQKGQRRSSFLAVRLTGEELTHLRDVAAKQGIGPSTFARMLLTSAIEQEAKSPTSRATYLLELTDKKKLEELARLIASELSSLTGVQVVLSKNAGNETARRVAKSSN